MKHSLLRLFLVTYLITMSLPALAAQGKVDILFDMGVVSIAPPTKFQTIKGTGTLQPLYDFFIRTENVAETKKAVAEAGGVVGVVLGSIMTVSLPMDAVQTMGSRPEVLYIEMPKPATTLSEIALKDIASDKVNAGTDLPIPLTGSNTIVGIVDTGIDVNHPDFLGSDGLSRIIYIWDQTLSGTPPAGMTYGAECNKTSIANKTCGVTDPTGHGTHVAGIAAGTYGVAPGAQIIAVRLKPELQETTGYLISVLSTRICEGIAYVFEKARSMGLPAVVNVSVGGHIGPHDGTSLSELCVTYAVAEDVGRSVVAAAGNENRDDPVFTGVHVGGDVSGDIATNFSVRTMPAQKLVYMDVWEREGSALAFGLRLYSSDSTVLGESQVVPHGSSTTGDFVTPNGPIHYQINATDVESALNGKPHVGILMKYDDFTGDPTSYNFDLLVSGTGHFNAWLYPDNPPSTVNFTSMEGAREARTFMPGDRKMSITIPASAANVISVAAYTTSNTWSDSTGTSHESIYHVGDIFPPSSSGPSANPELKKPEIAAPGALIVSAKSATSAKSIRDTDEQHWIMEGTSMAAPFVSGTVALMFSANPKLGFKQVADFLTSTARKDEFVGTVPNDRWGYGKLNAFDAVNAVVAAGGIAAPAAPAEEKAAASCDVRGNLSTPRSMRHVVAAIFVALAVPLIMFRFSRTRDLL